jgi:Flp pilus assembly protein TadB
MQQSEILITLVAFLFVGFVLWMISAQARAKIRYRAEVQKELISKFSSAQELADFLNSDAGKLLIRDQKDEDLHAKANSPSVGNRESIGYTIGFGVLFLCVGVAILIARGSVLAGAIFIALGVGNLINAGLRIYLAKRWRCWDQAPSTPNTNAS